jgi:YD repeat-containing protein
LETAFVDSPTGAPLASPRDVTYEYAASDPEAVSRLLAAEGDETFIGYEHDVSGNVVGRTHAAGESFEFLYDGDDWQRRAIAADGSSEIYYYDHGNRRILTVSRERTGSCETGTGSRSRCRPSRNRCSSLVHLHPGTILHGSGRSSNSKSWPRREANGCTTSGFAMRARM